MKTIKNIVDRITAGGLVDEIDNGGNGVSTNGSSSTNTPTTTPSCYKY